MVKIRFGVIGFLVASLLSLGSAVAGPLSPNVVDAKTVKALAGPADVVQVKGCHANKKWHMVHKWGYKAWHRHGYNCKPKHAKPPKPKGHCHKKWKKHWHQGWGNKWHRHPGKHCGYQKGNAGYKWGAGCVKVGSFWICG